jgi:glycosyltransferase involved in cell wall biosynthesis
MSQAGFRRTPSVTIGLPVYNGEQYLEAAVRSLLAQTYGDFELILSDNASTDRTPDICRMFAELDDRVQYCRNDVNIGSAGNHTRTVELAQSPLFKWAGCDDLYAPTYLDCCVAALSASHAVLAYPQTIVIDEEGNIVRNHDDCFHLVGLRPHERLRRVLRHSNQDLLNPSLGLVYTAALRRAMPVGRYYASDRVLLAQLAMEGEFHEVPERLFYRRVYMQQSSWTSGTDEEVTAWFDPAAKNSVTGPRFRKGLGYFGAVWRAEQPPAVKLRCFGTLSHFYLSTSRVPGAKIEMESMRRNVSQRVTGHQ